MIKYYRSWILVLLLVTLNCTRKTNQPVPLLVNTAHLDHLYEQITVHDTKMAIVHIYSNYPEYNWINAEDEGITCVDDVARAAVFYLEQFKITGDPVYRNKVKLLIRFLLYMQADNGWFYNFMKSDYSINTDYRTSMPLPTWWSWRALWAISETVLFLNESDSLDKKPLQICMAKSVQQLLLQQPDRSKLKNTAGFDLPTWLPYETGADQAAVLILFLVNYYKLTGRQEVLPYINGICAGVKAMQQGDKHNFPFSAFLSWENNWHSWGNTQAYALLLAYSIIPDQDLLSAALNEIDYFYPYLYQQQFLCGFSLQKENGKIIILSKQQFSQIAYGIRPMVWACLQAGKVTGDARYDIQAGQLAGWFFGENPAKRQMYDPYTGRCYDGINSGENINKNSGAESTIEALLTLIRIEQNPKAKAYLMRVKNEN